MLASPSPENGGAERLPRLRKEVLHPIDAIRVVAQVEGKFLTACDRLQIDSATGSSPSVGINVVPQRRATRCRGERVGKIPNTAARSRLRQLQAGVETTKSPTSGKSGRRSVDS